MTKAFKTGDVDIRNDLCANVVLSGGTTIFQGIGERVTLSFEFPDGNIITVGAKRFRCAGVLLRPRSAKICTPMSSSQVARQFSKGLASA